jgi:tetratricopeptide (TPR) repeat protein
MACFRVPVRPYEHVAVRIARCILLISACLAPLLSYGQSVQGPLSGQADSATLQGLVRDSRGRPVVGATVYLIAESEAKTLTVRTDSEGNYRFSALGAGVYTVRAEMAGYAEVTLGPCVLGAKETKQVDLTLQSATASAEAGAPPRTSGREQPQFFDAPEFIVAGVTEATNPGGHGSDTILRTTESLAKETASLNVPPLSGTLMKDESDSPPMASASLSATTEESLRKEAEREPGSFDLNHQLGKVLIDAGKTQEALPYLERASHLNPGDYENSYELSLAYSNVGQYERAQTGVRTLLAGQDNSGKEQAELHHLLADVEEKLNNPLEAVREYQRAAELDPSESNFFDWGADLLVHRAYAPAIEVFTTGNRRFPRSARMLAGLGVARYARGSYSQAEQCLCDASELNPDDPNPYLFLGKMQSAETTQPECLRESLARFSELQPTNALANYYYALSLWNRRQGSGSAEDLVQVQSLLEKSIHLDPKFGTGYLQLGILFGDRRDSAQAIASYQKAIEVSPELTEAHYRLAQAYSRTGEKSKAQAELKLYDQLSKKSAEEAKRNRREIQQFVYTLRDGTAVAQPK